MEYSKEAVETVMRKMEYEIKSHNSSAVRATSPRTIEAHRFNAMITTETLAWFKEQTGL